MKFFEPMKDTIVGFLSSVWDAICEWFGKVKQGFIDIGNWIWSWLEPTLNAIKDFFVNIGNGIADAFKTVTNKIGEFFTNAFNGIKKTLESIWTEITDLFGSIGNFFSDIISDAFNWGKNLIDNIKYLTPVYTEKASTTTAKEIASGEMMIPGAGRYIKDGEIVNTSIHKSVIHSNIQMTYKKVNAILL